MGRQQQLLPRMQHTRVPAVSHPNSKPSSAVRAIADVVPSLPQPRLQRARGDGSVRTAPGNEQDEYQKVPSDFDVTTLVTTASPSSDATTPVLMSASLGSIDLSRIEEGTDINRMRATVDLTVRYQWRDSRVGL